MRQRQSAHDAAAAIAEALERGAFSDAMQRLDTAVRHWPANAKLQLLKGTLLEKSQGTPQAALHFAGLAENPNIAAMAGKRLLPLIRRGAVTPDSVIELARRVSCSFMDAADKERILNAIVAQSAPDQRNELLDVLGSSGILRLECKLAVRKAEQGAFDEARRILELARQEGRTSAESVSLLAELYARSQRLPEAIAMLMQLRADYPDEPDCYLRLTTLLQRADDFAGAARIFEEAVERWPHNWQLLVRLHRLPLDRQTLERLFDTIARDADEALGKDERFRLQFALLCLHLGRIEQARDVLSLPFAAAASAVPRLILKTLTARTPAQWTGGSRLIDVRSAEVQVTRADCPRATVVVPTAIALSHLPLAFVDSLFADHAVNVVYLRDFAGRAHLRGVPALGRGETGTIEALGQLISSLGAARTIVMGTGAGGFTALRYGALLEADIAIAFSAPTELNTVFGEAKRAIANPNFPGTALLERDGDLPLDLVPLLSTPRRTKSILIYGDDAANDARQAQRVEGLPGVTLKPVAGIGDSNVLLHMIADGSFDQLIESLVEN
jgi:tetratricopeptide (TPR) repeat protein